MSTRTSRRQFTKTVAAAAAGTVVAADQRVIADEPDPVTATTHLMLDLVRARHGKHLSEEQLKRLRQKIRSEQLAAQRLHSVSLKNGDEPAFVFQADVS